MNAEIELLPVGTVVDVTEPGRDGEAPHRYVAKVVGYNAGRTKYELGRRYSGWGQWLFLAGGSWAFPNHVKAAAAGTGP